MLLTLPEMSLDHPEFSSLLRSAEFMKNVAVVVIDESHCVSQWGENFRKRYADLGKLQSYVPCTVPILAASATLPPHVLKQVQSRLLLSDESTFLINLGNDRRNIAMAVCHMRGAAGDLAALDFVLDEAHAGKDLVRTIVFFNSRDLCQRGYKYLRRKLPSHLRDKIGLMSSSASGLECDFPQRK